MIKLDPLKARVRIPTCPYCGSKAIWDSGALLQRSISAWVCAKWPVCDAYVGCHPNTKTPLGSLANAELRAGRMRVHHRMDQLWRNSGGALNRKEAYALVAAVMGRRSFHAGTSRNSDIEAFDKAWPRIELAARAAHGQTFA